MKKQDYSNHVRYYTPHHFIFYPLSLALFIFCVRGIYREPADSWKWIAVTAAVGLLIWLSFMMRQHYALTLQNRLVRLELRFRYYALTQRRLEPLEARLSFGQLAALRFADDDELPGLVERAISEGLAPRAIKKSIKNWLPDNDRV